MLVKRQSYRFFSLSTRATLQQATLRREKLRPSPHMERLKFRHAEKRTMEKKTGIIICLLSFYLDHSSVSNQTFLVPFVFKFRVKKG